MIFIIPICAFLWAFSGMEGTSLGWRRVGVALILCIPLWSGWITPLIWLVLFGAFSLPYGIPDSDDDGGAIGRFWYDIVSKHFSDKSSVSQVNYLIDVSIHEWTDILTRFTVGLAYGGALAIPQLVGGHCPLSVLKTLGTAIGVVLIHQHFNKHPKMIGDLNAEELAIGGLIGIMGVI